MYVCPECGASFEQKGFCTSDGSELASNASDAVIGTTIGHYRVARLLGVGGMGRVYKAVNPTIGSRVAIKVLSHDCAGSPELVERFFAEARAVNVIRHENIVNILDLAILPDNRPYIIMEYLDGSPLSAVIDGNRRLPIGSFVRIINEVLDALSAAHANAIVHRDLKPDNIFVSPQGRAKVLDFGIAKLMPEQSGRSGPTRDGSLLGTPHYMSPEQAQARPVDARTDIYAAGVILFEGTTGTKPFTGESLFDLLRQHIEAPPPPPRSIRADIPPALEATILRALAKNPDHRQQSARQLTDELNEATSSLADEAWQPIGTSYSSVISTRTPSSKSGSGAGVPSSSAPGSPRPATPLPAPHPQSSPTPQASGQMHQAATGGSQRGLMIGLALMLVAGAGIAIAVVSGGDDQQGSAVAAGNGDHDTDTNTTDDNTDTDDSTDDSTDTDSTDDNVRKNALETARKAIKTGEKSMELAIKEAETAMEKAANDVEKLLGGGRNSKDSADEMVAEKPPVKGGGTVVAATHTPKVVIGDISHKVSKTPNPSAFDVNGFIPTALKKARKVFPDAKLVRIDVDGVMPNGKANLTFESFDVLYRFQSLANSKRPKDLPLGIEHKPTCLYYVIVNKDNVRAYGLEGWACEMAYAGVPKCSTKQVWDKAIVKGAPNKNVFASLWYAGKRGKAKWHFSIKGTKISWWIPDNC